MNVKDTFKTLLMCHNGLLKQILKYKPLKFSMINDLLKAQGLRCKADVLVKFLDKQASVLNNGSTID